MLLHEGISAELILFGLLPIVVCAASAVGCYYFVSNNAMRLLIFAVVGVVSLAVSIVEIKEIVIFIRKKMEIFNDAFYIFEDVIEEKSTKNMSTAIKFKKYNSIVKFPIYFDAKAFQSANIGDKYFLVKLKSCPQAMYLYPAARYQLHDDIKDRKVNINVAYEKKKERA
jgi:hypothetical protein